MKIKACLIYLLFVSLIAGYWLVFVFARDFHQSYFRGEDKLVEWITFFGFFGGGVVCLRTLRFKLSMNKLARLYFLGLAFFFLVCAGEEISWGQRIFGFGTPENMVQQNEQGEFNLHNLNFEHFHPIVIVSVFMMGFGIVAPLIMGLCSRNPEASWRRYISPPHLIPCFIFAEMLSPIQKKLKPWLLENFGSDMAILVRRDTRELAEMCWGLCVLFAALALYATWKKYKTHES